MKYLLLMIVVMIAIAQATLAQATTIKVPKVESALDVNGLDHETEIIEYKADATRSKSRCSLSEVGGDVVVGVSSTQCTERTAFVNKK